MLRNRVQSQLEWKKYIPVQTNREIQGDVFVEKSDKTVKGLILPEIVYKVKRKLGCIFGVGKKHLMSKHLIVKTPNVKTPNIKTPKVQNT